MGPGTLDAITDVGGVRIVHLAGSDEYVIVFSTATGPVAQDRVVG